VLSETTKRQILDGVAALGPGRPLPIVVASNDYARLLDNWLCHMDALAIERILVVAMDATLAARLANGPYPVACGSFDGSEKDFWLQRTYIWSFLVDQGIEYIQSDVDAVWLRDPIAAFSQLQFDLAISEGTGHPLDIHAIWNFVLCTGFFWVRPTQAAQRFLHMLVDPPEPMLRSDDQALLNRMLSAMGMLWMTGNVPSYQLRLHTLPFTCYREPLQGFCASLGLRLTMLPHHLFPRIQPGDPNAIVRHVLREGSQENRIQRMREHGCWLLDARPNGFALDR